MMANQCVSCGASMPEGDQVCKGCQSCGGIYPYAINVRVTTEQMEAIDRSCVLGGMRISEVMRGILDMWVQGRIDVPPGFDSRRDW